MLSFLGMQAVIHSDKMKQLLDLVARMAKANASVLVTGESGVGKELIARALHHFSVRCSRPWVDVNCGALPENLVESELFGYEKGAFSGADQPKPGLFELANTGTLFLDEIGELDPRMQVKLLRVLDGVPYSRLGGVKKVCVDVRIIAATNQDLEQAIQQGRFRSDLYHRLNQLNLYVPALRERSDDILPLAQHFLAQVDPEASFSEEVLAALCSYPWPGNIRELRNVVSQSAVLASDKMVRTCDLPSSLKNAPRTSQAIPAGSLEEMEKQMILTALDQTGGHQARAAAILGISRRTLTRKLKIYGNAASEPAFV
jgi:transcriptional regulator with PAS, ATPase and Fis domain